MENGKNQLHKSHLLMTNKSTTINEHSIVRKFLVENSDEYSNSRKSKYTNNTKLTKSSLFKALTGLNVKREQHILKELNLQIELLQGSYFNLNHLENHIKKQLSQSFSDFTNTIDELLTSQNR